jgi:hypothetical protein
LSPATEFAAPPVELHPASTAVPATTAVSSAVRIIAVLIAHLPRRRR